jgi:predicted RNA-binding protein with EMAP domain
MIIEFETKINKPNIQIPEFKKLKNKKAKIVIITEENDFITKVINKPYNVREFLNRVEANER